MVKRWLYLGKVVVFEQIGSTWAKDGCIWEKWWYLGKRWLYLWKVVLFGQIGSIVVVFGQRCDSSVSVVETSTAVGFLLRTEPHETEVLVQCQAASLKLDGTENTRGTYFPKQPDYCTLLFVEHISFSLTCLFLCYLFLNVSASVAPSSYS